MGRKKKNTPPAKTHDIHLRVTEEMYEAIKADAAKAKLSVADYCRQAINGRTIKIYEDRYFDSEELLHALGDYGKIGSNLNQIAHYLNGGGIFDKQLKTIVLEACIAITKIRDMVNEVTGEYRGSY